MENFKQDNTVRYFVIRAHGCGTTLSGSDIVGITTDEEKARSMQSVFYSYEEVKFIK